MVQFNLLPDVKIEYIKTRYRKRLIILVSSVVTVVFVAIFALLFAYVKINQKVHINNLNDDIKLYTKQINEVQDLDKILTIQNQLNSLPSLHNQKVISSRMVGYLGQVTPADATISNIEVDFKTNKMTIKGNAPDLIVVNKFTDSLKFTDYKVNGKIATSGEENSSGRAFKNIVLTSFSVPTAQASNRPSQSAYNITLEFEPIIFAKVVDTKQGELDVALTVPSITSSRSETQKPTLFQQQPQTETEGQ